MVASKWRELSDEDHKKLQEEARKVGKADVQTLTNEERKKIIKKEKNNLVKQVN